MIEGYRQGLPRQLRLSARNLEPTNGFSSRAGVLTSLAAITGQAELASDRLEDADGREIAMPFALAIRPLPGEGAARMLLTLSLTGGPEATCTADLIVPRAVFDALLADWASGRAGRLAFTAATDLWGRADEADLPEDRISTWRLGPGRQADGAVEAKGLVENLSWSPAAPAEPTPSEPAAEEDDTEDLADMLARIGGSLKLGLVLLAFLVLVIALK